MDIDHINLPPGLVADLYSSHLIREKEMIELPALKVSSKNSWVYAGNNEKNILLLVNYTNHEELNTQQFSFIENLLAACKISLSDIVLLNLCQNINADYKNLQAHFKSRVIFLFGVEPSSVGLPLSFPQFQVQTFANCTFLFTPPLEELEGDKVLKSKLWVCLRRIFGI